jgi:hypothetical protein
MRRVPVLLALLLATCDSSPGGVPLPACGVWLQWGSDPAHAGASCVAAQPMARQLGEVQYDPFVLGEEADAGGDLIVHYQVPLLAGDDVYIEAKSGTYTPCVPALPPNRGLVCAPYRLSTQVWNEVHFAWEKGKLVQKWIFASDWKPEPYPGFEPMFQPAIVGDRLYVPGAGGTLEVVDRATGTLISRLQPFGSAIDPDTYVASPVASDGKGNLYYTTLTLNHDNPWGIDGHGSLVRVGADGAIKTVAFEDLVQGAPGKLDICHGVFSQRTTPLPWPPPDNPDGTPVLPDPAPCGAQRPGINAAPAIGPDGTIFVVSTGQIFRPSGQPRCATSSTTAAACSCPPTVTP